MMPPLRRPWSALDHNNQAMKVPLCVDVCPAMLRHMGIMGGSTVPLGAEKNGVLEERKW